jgi:hypothetical protein
MPTPFDGGRGKNEQEQVKNYGGNNFGEKNGSSIGPMSPISGSRIRGLNTRKFFFGVAVGFVGILILSAIILGVGIYRLGWNGKAVHKLTKILPYPVAFVNWHVVSFFDYQDDIMTLQNFFAKQEEAGGTTEGIPTDNELKKSVLDRLIQNEIAGQLAKKYKVTVSDGDLEAEIGKIVAQDGSREKVEETLKSQYGWGIDQFKIKILKPFILQQKLQEAIAKDESLNQEIKKKAEEVLAEVKKGEKSFEELAGQYSEDGTATEGGDLGYFGKGTMVAEFEQAAFALGKGEVSGLVQTKYGYHIIKVEEQIKDASGEITQVRARHILLKTKSLDDVLSEETGKAKIWRLIKF